MSAARELTHDDLEGIEPAKCPACTYDGFVFQTDERGSLVFHPGRIFPCRVPL